jgi:hypothetical protein
MIVDRSKTYNSYFTAYIDVHGTKDGDEVEFHEYSGWITGLHNAFRKIKGCEYCNGYPPEVQKEFELFIREGVERDE